MKKSARQLTTILAAGLMAMMATGCSGSSDTTSAATTAAAAAETNAEAAADTGAAEATGDIVAAVDEIRIGMVNPMSGDNALYGMDQSRAMNLAFEEINAAGGAYGATFSIEEYDDQGDPQNSAKGAQKFVDDESILAVIGSSLSSCTLAMNPIIDDGGLVDMVVSSSSPSLMGVSDYFFRMSVQDNQVGPQIAKVILDEGYTDIVVLYPNNDYGINLAENLVAYAEENGGNILDSIDYNASDQDFTAILTTVKNKNPQAVALCGTVTDSSLLISQMSKLGIDCFKMGGTSLYNTNAINIAGDALEGVGCISVYISSNPDTRVQEFVAKYEEKYDETPDAFAALAYDMAYVLYEASMDAMDANGGEISRDSLRDAIDGISYEGITGTVSFDENNDWVRDYLALTVKDGEFILMD
ncbi:MAG: ABC transporter substrate-binding protein [Clostridiales bacterium]|nr:ABC transporter substrate-binding protein [Clostridiales bacterium]